MEECLKLQLEAKEQVDPLCYDLVQVHLMEIAKGNYRQIARERDAWRMAYEQEHGIKVAQQATIEVQQILLRNKKVKDCGGHVGGKIGGRK